MKTRFFRVTRFARRALQAGSLLLFLYLASAAVGPLPEAFLPVDAFLRFDPLITVLVPAAAREWVPALWPGLIVLASAFALGRFFCGRICPMGVTLDMARSLLLRFFGPALRKKNRAASAVVSADADRFAALYGLKYLLFAVCAGAAFLGVNLLYWLSPIALVTRLYTLLLHSLSLQLAGRSWGLLRPVAAGASEGDSAGLFASLLHELGFATAELEYLTIVVRDYATLGFVAAFFSLLFALELIRPRFWCRYLCPAGALLGLCSRQPLRRRRVHTCIACGACARACPTGAVRGKGALTAYAECITCNTCVDVCPVQGVEFRCTDRFPSAGLQEGRTTTQAPPLPSGRPPAAPEGRFIRPPAKNTSLPTRRRVLAATGGGMLLAGITAYTPRLPVSFFAGAAGCVRPPGALPEAEFLARCVRCGLCMKVCPSNGLQPVWFATDLSGCFSPALVSRIGVCEPGCNACGEVCPTGALHALPLAEKQQAKIGTAEVLRQQCLAWAKNRSCVVCEEVCPYGAVTMLGRPSTGESGSGNEAPVDAAGPSDGAPLAVPRPEVDPSRCFGCGYCERFCPVSSPAVVVRPMGALRLSTPSYASAAESAGLSLKPTAERDTTKHLSHELPGDALPPGFTE